MKAKLLGAAATVGAFMLGSPALASIVDVNNAGIVLDQDANLTRAGIFVGDATIFGDHDNNIFDLNPPIDALIDRDPPLVRTLSQISNYISDFLSNPTIFRSVIEPDYTSDRDAL